MLYLIFLVFALVRLRRWLHFFQQHEYDSKRFLAWIWQRKLFDKRGSIIALLGLFSQFFYLLFIPLSLLEPKKEKKPLAWTARAKRIFTAALILIILVTILFHKFWQLIIMIQLLPLALVLAVLILWPQEKLTQRKYLQEAQKILRRYNPIVIGITGSYGKTTTKYILGNILNHWQPTLWTPGSVNTLMGITRTVREELKPEHKYFVVELGAYKIGSIKKLCDLVKPSHGIITSVGIAHYERFKSIENVKKAKYELFDSLPPQGIAISGRNSALAMARALGVPEPLIKIKPPLIPHRLEIRPGPITIIDDAYNSNPIGFKSALLKLKEFSGRKILITPGMVELGERSQEEHRKIAGLIAKICDYVILVGRESTKYLQKYLKDYYLFPSLSGAQEFVQALAKEGDVILYENDLPDIYDQQIKF